MPARTNGKLMWAAVAAAVCFLVLAFGGSYITSHHINSTADTRAASAGRPGEPSPNNAPEQQTGRSGRGASTTGASTANPKDNVPPATQSGK